MTVFRVRGILLMICLLCQISAESAFSAQRQGDKNALVIAMSSDFKPFTFLNAGGKPAGILVDIWQLWAEKNGRKIEFVVSDWKTSIENLKNGKADAHSGVSSLSGRDWARSVQPIYKTDISLFYPRRQGKIVNLKEFAGKSLAAVKGTQTELYLKTNYPKINIVSCDARADLVKATLTGKAQGFIAITAVGGELTDSMGFSGDIAQMQPALYSENISPAVRSEDVALLHVLNDGFNAITRRELAEIEARWVTDPKKSHYSNPSAITLTPVEQKWLAEHPTVRLGMSPVFPPLKFTDNGVLKGIEPDYLNALSEITGLKFEFVVTDFTTMDDKVKSGELDMFLSFNIPHRLAYMTFTDPFMDSKSVFVARNDATFISGLGSLKGKRVATVKGVKLYEKILAPYPEITAVPVATMEQMYQAVVDGKADALIAKTMFVGYLMKNFPSLKVAGIAELPPEPYLYAVRKDYPELVSIINKGINAVPPERRDAILQKWFNVQIEYQPRWQEILKWSALTGGGFSLLLGLTLYWNRRLKAEIEHRVLAESELVQQRSVLEGVLESTESAVFSVDRAFKYTSFNATHKQIMGALYAAEIKHGESLLSYQTDADAAIAKGNLERALAGEAFVIEAESGDNARVRTVFEISHNPVKSVAGDVIGVAVFARDISAQKRAERDLLAIQAQVIQQEKLATIGQLAAGVAHEINNPVGFIKSNLVSLEKYNRKIFDYLAKEKAAAERYLPKTEQAELANLWRSSKLDFICKDIIDLVRESTEGTERVRRIVQDLVSFSRSQGDELVPVDVNQCLESTLAIAWNEIKHQAELRSELQPVPDVMANSQKLSQVFLNLLVNASHAVAKGGVISLRTWQEGDSVCVSVADNGCGIPPEIRGKIFEPFFTTKEVGKGTGLGLAISHDLVVKFGGSISLESAVGVGTTFTVRLPVVQERADA